MSSSDDLDIREPRKPQTRDDRERRRRGRRKTREGRRGDGRLESETEERLSDDEEAIEELEERVEKLESLVAALVTYAGILQRQNYHGPSYVNRPAVPESAREELETPWETLARLSGVDASLVPEMSTAVGEKLQASLIDQWDRLVTGAQP